MKGPLNGDMFLLSVSTLSVAISYQHFDNSKKILQGGTIGEWTWIISCVVNEHLCRSFYVLSLTRTSNDLVLLKCLLMAHFLFTQGLAWGGQKDLRFIHPLKKTEEYSLNKHWLNSENTNTSESTWIVIVFSKGRTWHSLEPNASFLAWEAAKGCYIYRASKRHRGNTPQLQAADEKCV